jgi:uncharacterized protein (DUF58 family)
MRLTRRGRVVLGVTGVGFVLAWLFGARALNAVVLPALVALVAAAVQVGTTNVPGLTREVPPDGFPGDTGTVTLRFHTSSPFGGTVTDELDAGLSGDATVETTVGARPVDYEVTYEARGQQTIGMARVVARDVLGLAETEFACSGTDSVLVYPRVHEVAPWARRSLRSLYDIERSRERDEFDRLREYERGDPLRDVHWRSSAKRDDLVVKEFAAESMADAISITAGARVGHADEMAETVASLATVLVDAGIPVAVSTPNGRVSVGSGGLTTVLEHLALASSGKAPDADADVTVVAEDDEVVVRIGGEKTTFAAMRNEVDGDGVDRRREVAA